MSIGIRTLPFPSGGSTIYIDACKIVLGCVLIQNRHVVAYASRQFKPFEVNYLTHELDLAVEIFSLKIWRCYLHGEACELFTDHKCLKYVFSFR